MYTVSPYTAPHVKVFAEERDQARPVAVVVAPLSVVPVSSEAFVFSAAGADQVAPASPERVGMSSAFCTAAIIPSPR